MAAAGHVPVMLDEVLALVDATPGQTIVDCTAGAGGHLAAFAERVGPTGRVIALDRDPRAHQPDAAGGVAARFADRVTLVQAPFSAVRVALDEVGVERADALFADLGVSSLQLDEPERGFSFRSDAPLDMRMDTTSGETAAELIRRLDERELADVIYLHGEEHKSRRIARTLKREQPTTTAGLAEAVIHAVGDPRVARRGGGIHPATRTFQALRIAVNRELDELDELLAALPSVLRPGGRAIVLSFHSLEDRRVKLRFRSEGYTALTKRPQVPSDAEMLRNPRARSAKLRAALVDVVDAGRRAP
ncbi:MAG: 16S rRNA (cytosine(1402)-N(4))-methyltransferase RsmH [Deltaproteobacteria bacterium]|nr:16S rRNA (cytosine(1402)-N(4))-methyltransferase RsmH [Deltaproteobacteria bacterium]